MTGPNPDYTYSELSLHQQIFITNYYEAELTRKLRQRAPKFTITGFNEMKFLRPDRPGWYRITIATMLDYTVYRYWNGRVWFDMSTEDYAYLHDNGGLNAHGKI